MGTAKVESALVGNPKVAVCEMGDVVKICTTHLSGFLVKERYASSSQIMRGKSSAA